MFYQTLVLNFALISVAARGRCVCPPGTFHITSTTCKKCPAGTFQAESGQSSCIPCAPNRFSEDGSRSCRPCGNNSIPTGNIGAKCACQTIEYPSELPPREGCLHDHCAPGKVPMGLKYGTFCIDCPRGSFKPSEKGDCRPCPRGAFPDQGRTSCTKCEKDQILISTGKCGICPPGMQPTEYVQDGDTMCQNCPPGSFKSRAGNQECQSCPPETFSLEKATKCVKCPKGTALLANGECGSCPPGQSYDPMSASCRQCSLGSFSPKANASYKACRSCPKGTFAVQLGANKCFPCPKGKVMMLDGKCKACPKGTFYNLTRAKCERCYGASIGRGGDSKSCESCGRNEWPNKKKTACILCPEGTAYFEEEGKCGKCRAGFYFNYPGRVFSSLSPEGPPGCTKCTLGFTDSESLSPYCQSCPEGKIPVEQRTRCLPKCKMQK